jgi:hypothetical protein
MADGWMPAWLQQQLGSIWVIFFDNRELTRLAHGNVIFHFEAEHAGIKTESLGLIIDQKHLSPKLSFAAPPLFSRPILEGVKRSGRRTP